MKQHPIHAFTLVELLLVMAIITILLSFVVPAFNSLGQSTNLTAACQLLVDELNGARQVALTKNRQVEFRFYYVTSNTGDSAAYRAFRYFLLDETGQNAKPIGKVDDLPTGVIISGNAQFSTIEGNPALAKGAAQETLPGRGSVDYRFFRYRPDGSTDLDATQKWFWTIRLLNDRADQATLPANFAAIQLDPVTGRPRLFRP